MKMAEKAVMLTFQNNCESINSKCVDVDGEKTPNNNDIIIKEIVECKQEEEPEKVECITQEDAGEQFLAGENKSDTQDDLLNADLDNERNDYKEDNNVLGEGHQQEEKMSYEDIDEPEALNIESEENHPSEEEEEEEAESLTKMQIMEDVREGCNIQPSSPGHAEQRLNKEDNTEVKQEQEFVESPINEKQEVEDVNGNEKEEEKEMDEIVNDVEKCEESNGLNHENEESSNTSSSEEIPNNKRKREEHDNCIKRLRIEIQENYLSRDKILNEFIELSDTHTVEQMQTQTEQILAEIRTLNELAKEKEKEWNNIIHLKKMKEELLLRMQRRKQVMLLNTCDKNENGDPYLVDNHNVEERLKTQNQSILKANLINTNKLKMTNSPIDKTLKNRNNVLPKTSQYSMEMNGDYRQNKQRPILDVQSIIADYRQRHPETVPRRGRRIRNSGEVTRNAGNILSFASLAHGSGAQVHQNIQNMDNSSELGILLNALDGGKNDGTKGTGIDASLLANEPSFKDMLVQFAKLSQSERNEIFQNVTKPPPPYPEVTVHPVPTTSTVAPTNSLLHGILTKNSAKTNTKTSFSPTLARLLTAPERGGNLPNNPITNQNNTTNMSISEILSSSKKFQARNEITITPVGSQFDVSAKTTKTGNRGIDEDETEDSADRLVIDESTENADRNRGGDNNSDTGDEVPQCQGCNQKSALFVCAGCGNQWYCSRDCQVAAWDEHSEVCSG